MSPDPYDAAVTALVERLHQAGRWDEIAALMSPAERALVDDALARHARALPAGDDDQVDDWHGGEDAATWTPAPDVPAPVAPQRKYGRVRVYPTYTWRPVGAGIPDDDEVTITDWRKRGQQWAEQQARDEIRARYGPDREFWLGRPVKDTFRWRPYAGTPADALPFDAGRDTDPNPGREDEPEWPDDLDWDTDGLTKI